MKFNTSEDSPLVSILINNYNYGSFISEAIDSALNQSYFQTEVIVVDDGSTDNSREIIASYGNRIIPVLKDNGGQASAFNAGVAACQGNIIFFLDSDDVFYANKVKEISDVLTTKMVNDPCVMVYHLLECVDMNGASLGCRIPKSLYNVPANLYQYACQYKFFPYAATPTSGIAISRELAMRIFPIPEKGVRTSADEFLVRPALLLGQVYGLDCVLSEYRIHGKNNWYGHQKVKTKEFSVLLEQFLNKKLKENNKNQVISFFNSMYAREYYMLYGSSKDLFKLVVQVPTWRISFKTIRFFFKTTFLAIVLQVKPGRVMPDINRTSVPTGDNALIFPYLPNDNSAQTHSMKEALKIVEQYEKRDNALEVLDLGCGIGSSFETFQKSKMKFNWTGLDIDDSPEVNSRIRDDLNFLTYNGIHIPLPDDSVDIIYSHQVFEHVRHPEKLLIEVIRVLRKGGYFVGSTSQLEPFHSRSFCNFTPYGYMTLLETTGFSEIFVKPGIDCITLILRSLLGHPMSRMFNTFFTRESPLNFAIEMIYRLLGFGVKRRCALKLKFSGQFVFIARKQSN